MTEIVVLFRRPQPHISIALDVSDKKVVESMVFDAKPRILEWFMQSGPFGPSLNQGRGIVLSAWLCSNGRKAYPVCGNSRELRPLLANS